MSDTPHPEQVKLYKAIFQYDFAGEMMRIHRVINIARHWLGSPTPSEFAAVLVEQCRKQEGIGTMFFDAEHLRGDLCGANIHMDAEIERLWSGSFDPIEETDDFWNAVHDGKSLAKDSSPECQWWQGLYKACSDLTEVREDWWR